MTKKPKRARSARREADRDVVKLRSAIEKSYALEAGGSRERPIELASAAQVEPDAESRACPYCAGGMWAQGHDVVEHAGARLRVARLVCKSCHTRWDRFYRLGPVLN